ncbi:MAG: hypothetical protein KJ647_04825 [Candidatus Omnitrophica bacterium]|nr:hypothetical protein [Candidatus Omnitrophota bacterium]MCG2713292.1 hypothetical protein [Candidatus Omnitrophota bacterium]
MDKTVLKCAICGRKPRGICPALEKIICPACCGSERGSKIHCIPSCGYFPFGVTGYDLWLKVDEGLVRKKLDYLKSSYNYREFEEMVEHMRFASGISEEDVGTAEGAAVYYLFFVKRDADGRTLAQKWQTQGWVGLNNDERIMMEYRFSCRATVIEIEKVLDHQSMECIDLLEPEKGNFVLIDRATAARSVRWTRMLTWLAHYPYFSRIANNGVELSDSAFAEFMDSLRDAFRKENRKHKELVIKDYLSENFGVFGSLIYDLSRERSIAVLKRMDLHQCRAIYKIKGNYGEIKAILDKNPDFEQRERHPDEQDLPGVYYYSWLRRGQSKALEKNMPAHFRHGQEKDEGVGTVGNISLFPDKLIVEAFTKQKHSFAKRMVKKFFGENLLLQNEVVVDLAKQQAGKMEIDYKGYAREIISNKEKSDTKGIPPEVERELMQKFYKRHYTIFLEDKIPALDEMTPRAAAVDPQMRPKLIELMKQHLKGIEQQNKDRGLDLNIDWVLDELSLPELK